MIAVRHQVQKSDQCQYQFGLLYALSHSSEVPEVARAFQYYSRRVLHHFSHPLKVNTHILSSRRRSRQLREPAAPRQIIGPLTLQESYKAPALSSLPPPPKHPHHHRRVSLLTYRYLPLLWISHRPEQNIVCLLSRTDTKCK